MKDEKGKATAATSTVNATPVAALVFHLLSLIFHLYLSFFSAFHFR